ncbi:MAG: class I SAM-dependent RNA methyltransferase, partial [Gordonia sp. (in: high G+C Gram-positive bacteria)]
RRQRVLEGGPSAEHRLGARSWQIPVTGFWQGHRAAPDTYARTVADLVAGHLDGAAGVGWDLYGGAGVFTATLLDDLAATAVHLVDSDAGALAAAADTFAADGRVHRHQGEVAAVVAGLPAPRVVVVDPPRTGAGPRVIAHITAAGPQVIVAVGCDVARFARDLSLYAAHGYRPREVRGFDAFPLTHHLEAIAVLVRG